MATLPRGCLLIAAGLSGCLTSGRPPLRCGAGTMLSDGACIGPASGEPGTIADRCGAGTIRDGNFCVPDEPDVASTAPCVGDPKVIHVESDGYILNGAATVTDAMWHDQSRRGSVTLEVLVHTGDPRLDGGWSLGFEMLGIDLAPGIYENASHAGLVGPGTPGIDISHFIYCDDIAGRFQIHAIAQQGDGKLLHALISFVEHCNGAANTLSGCMQYSP